MPLIDNLRVYGEDLRPLLGGGERALALVLCQQAYGDDQLERSPDELGSLFAKLPDRVRQDALRTLPEPPRNRAAWERVVDTALFGPDVDPTAVDRAIGGVSARGHAGSWAAQLMAAVDRGVMVYLLVTDRRLLLVEQSPGDAEGFATRFAIPRAAVLGVRRKGTLLQRGRVVLDFADLSQAALMTGIFAAGPADSVVEAFRSVPGGAG